MKSSDVLKLYNVLNREQKCVGNRKIARGENSGTHSPNGTPHAVSFSRCLVHLCGINSTYYPQAIASNKT